MKRIPENPFTVIRGGLHPDATLGKTSKPDKATQKKLSDEFKRQLEARLRIKIRADMERHAKRFWENEAAKAKQRAHSSTENDRQS